MENREKEQNYFERLFLININDKVEKKNGLSYVSWSYAWGEVKKLFPNSTYTIYENKDEWNYFTDGRTGWVKTGVTINELEHIEELPIMDFRNKSILLESITSFDVNKTIQRSLTKAIARHGLGLYIYAGEDLPEEPKEEPKKYEVMTTKEKIKTYSNAAEVIKTTYSVKLSELNEEEQLNVLSKLEASK